MTDTALLALLVAKLNARKKRLLLIAQASLPQPHQFDAYRTLLLDELGRDGFEKELAEALTPHTERQGTGRNIHAKKEVAP